MVVLAQIDHVPRGEIGVLLEQPHDLAADLGTEVRNPIDVAPRSLAGGDGVPTTAA